jgi:hypothetical protein
LTSPATRILVVHARTTRDLSTAADSTRVLETGILKAGTREAQDSRGLSEKGSETTDTKTDLNLQVTELTLRQVSNLIKSKVSVLAQQLQMVDLWLLPQPLLRTSAL